METFIGVLIRGVPVCNTCLLTIQPAPEIKLVRPRVRMVELVRYPLINESVVRPKLALAVAGNCS